MTETMNGVLQVRLQGQTHNVEIPEGLSEEEVVKATTDQLRQGSFMEEGESLVRNSEGIYEIKAPHGTAGIK